ncbi:MAG: hypothetical protein ACP5H2_08980 [Solirubrobacteraceae bacterium]
MPDRAAPRVGEDVVAAGAPPDHVRRAEDRFVAVRDVAQPSAATAISQTSPVPWTHFTRGSYRQQRAAVVASLVLAKGRERLVGGNQLCFHVRAGIRGPERRGRDLHGIAASWGARKIAEASAPGLC